jgi:hypothetical protein
MAVTVNRLKDFVSIIPSGGMTQNVYDVSSSSHLFGMSSNINLMKTAIDEINTTLNYAIELTGITKAQYEIRLAYNVNGDVQYAGYAEPGTTNSDALWRISKFFYNGSDMTGQRFADADPDFDNVWDNRESLDYSY